VIDEMNPTTISHLKWLACFSYNLLGLDDLGWISQTAAAGQGQGGREQSASYA